MTRRSLAKLFVGVVSLALVGACAGDRASSPRPIDDGLGAGAADSLKKASAGEWHLATIRGALLGASSTDTLHAATVAIANAKVEVHAGDLETGSDPRSLNFRDRGVVATLTSGPNGEIDYVVPDPIVVKTGQPSPMRTYRMIISPPAGSAYAARDVQVYFAEQAPSGAGRWKYYLWLR